MDSAGNLYRLEGIDIYGLRFILRKLACEKAMFQRSKILLNFSTISFVLK